MNRQDAEKIVARMQQINERNSADPGASTADIQGIPKSDVALMTELMELGFKVAFKDHEILRIPHDTRQCVSCKTWVSVDEFGLDTEAHRCPVIEL